MRVSWVEVTLRLRNSSESAVTGRKASSSSFSVTCTAGACATRTAPALPLVAGGHARSRGSGSKTRAGATALASGTRWSSSIWRACWRRLCTISLRSSSSNCTPATSAAQAMVSSVISAPSATFAQRTPGRSVPPSPVAEK
jgi:hypothetical protein